MATLTFPLDKVNQLLCRRGEDDSRKLSEEIADDMSSELLKLIFKEETNANKDQEEHLPDAPKEQK